MSDITLRGFAGINNLTAPERLRSLPTKDNPLVELVEALNVDIDDTGRPSRRAGQTLKVAGAAHSLWSNGQACLFVKAGTMYRLSESFAAVAIAAGLSADPVVYVEANDRVYHANGRTSAVYEQGFVRSWGIPLDWADARATPARGLLPAGIYLYAMTLLRADGQESGTGPAKRIDLAEASALTFSWPLPDDSDIRHAALYLSQANGKTLFQAAVVEVNSGPYTYVGGARSLPLTTQWLDKPPAGAALASYRGRIYIAVGDVLYATSALSYEHCDLRDYRAFDGSEIRLVAAVEGGLFVGTARGVYFMAGAAFADNSLSKKMDCAAIKGSLVLADGQQVTGLKDLAGLVVALFATAEGIVLGLPDGSMHNLTVENYAMPAAASGAAIFRASGPTTQYLLSTLSP